MNKDKKHINEKMLLRFLLGELNQEEEKVVSLWLGQSENNRHLLNSYESLWAETGKLDPAPVAVDTLLVWEKMSEKIDRYENSKPRAIQMPLRTKVAYVSTGIAALFIVLFGISRLTQKQTLAPNQLKIISSAHIVHDTLPDGTRLALNKNSVITYPKHFANRERRVKLEGEAFFNVQAHEKQSFVIETEKAYVKVLGTSFNVKAYKMNDIEVTVLEGTVQLFTVGPLSGDTLSIVLGKGQSGKVPIAENKPVFIANTIPDASFWMDYSLVFIDTGLKKVFELLEDHYKIIIKVNNDSIYHCKLSTTFTGNTIGHIMDVIAATFDLKYTKDDTIYTFQGDGCNKKNK